MQRETQNGKQKNRQLKQTTTKTIKQEHAETNIKQGTQEIHTHSKKPNQAATNIHK